MLATLANLICNLYALGLLAYVLFSYVPDPRIRSWYHRMEPFYEPFLKPLRERLPSIELTGGRRLDLSPLALFMIIIVIREVLYRAFERPLI